MKTTECIEEDWGVLGVKEEGYLDFPVGGGSSSITGFNYLIGIHGSGVGSEFDGV